MRAKYELLDESNMDIDDLEAERDLQMAAVDAIRRARRCGTDYVIWEDERIKEVHPDQTAPYETNLLASAERLNQRIVMLKSAVTPARALNDQPSPKPSAS